MFVRLLIVLALIPYCSISIAEETPRGESPAHLGEEDPAAERIPLDQIWALNMPGTQNVKDLYTHKDLRNTAISKIHEVLFRSGEVRAKAGPCFLVMGEGKEALLNAAKVIVDGTPPAKTLPPDKNVWLVFYSYPASGYVHLQSVRQTRTEVTVRFHVVTHRSADSTSHFAIIPLGKLPAGQVDIKVIEVPSETPYTNHDKTDRVVCDSCTFTIQNKGAEP